MRKALADVLNWCAALADRARFYLKCAAEGDLLDCCIVALGLLIVLAVLLGITFFFINGWWKRFLAL